MVLLVQMNRISLMRCWFFSDG